MRSQKKYAAVAEALYDGVDWVDPTGEITCEDGCKAMLNSRLAIEDAAVRERLRLKRRAYGYQVIVSLPSRIS